MTGRNFYTLQPDQLVVYSAAWCPDCRRTRYFLIRHHISYLEVDVDQDPSAEEFVRTNNHGNCSVPTLIFPDSTTLTEPSTSELAAKFSTS